MKYLLLIALTLNLHAWGYDSYAQNSLKSRLKDVDSAKFKNLSMHGKMICGQVNAKNSFGGYTGYRDFVGNGSVGFFESDAKSYNEWVKIWNKSCK